MRVPWTARRSNQSILKEIGPRCSLVGLMLKLKLQYFGHMMQRTDSLEKTLMLGKIEGGRRIISLKDTKIFNIHTIYIASLYPLVHFSSVQSLSRVQLFAAPWTAAHQASLSITNSQSLLKLMSIESVMPSNHLILCRPLLLLPSGFLSIRVFSNESVLPIRWPKYWSFSFNISPTNEHPGLISFRMDWLDLIAVQGTLKSLLQHHSSTGSGTRNTWTQPGHQENKRGLGGGSLDAWDAGPRPLLEPPTTRPLLQAQHAIAPPSAVEGTHTSH